MTAHPYICLVDYELGYRIALTVEDTREESDAVCVLRIVGESAASRTVDLCIGLSREAIVELVQELSDRLAETEDAEL